MTRMNDRTAAPATDGTLTARKYGDAAGYDIYMGQWSSALAPLFLAFAALPQPASLLDVGCGTGNLLAAATAFFPNARLVGVDPSAALLGRARGRVKLARALLLVPRIDQRQEGQECRQHHQWQRQAVDRHEVARAE